MCAGVGVVRVQVKGDPSQYRPSFAPDFGKPNFFKVGGRGGAVQRAACVRCAVEGQ